MIDADYCVTLARYNAWMNERIYALCAELPEEERRRDRGAFFGSLHRTLDHIVYGDLAILSRLTGDPPESPPLGEEIHRDFTALRAARAALDARLLAWSARLTPADFAAPFTYTSRVDGQTRTLPTWVFVVHLFQHQVHHRGQVTTLLSQLGLDPGSTDLPFTPGLATLA